MTDHRNAESSLNILQIISGRSVNGALVYCKILSERLSAKGHNVTIVCRPKSWVAANVNRSKIRVVESSMAKFPLSEFNRIRAIMNQEETHLIHSHMTRAQNFAIGLKMLTGVPVVATAHNRHFEIHWNFNDFVIANSKSTYDYHSRINRVPPSRMETIHCCADFDRFEKVDEESIAGVRSRLRLCADDFLVCVVGEFAIRKGHVHLIKALPKIVEQVPNLKVVFVGRFGRKQPHVRQMRKMILERGLQGRIKWVGRQSNVADYMAASQMTIVPSIEEPLGLVAIESQLANTPVVASATGGLKEIVKHEETGLLFSNSKHDALADSVIRLAHDEALRNRLAEQGLNYASTNFAPGRLIDQVEAVYNRILAQINRQAA